MRLMGSQGKFETREDLALGRAMGSPPAAYALSSVPRPIPEHMVITGRGFDIRKHP